MKSKAIEKAAPAKPTVLATVQEAKELVAQGLESIVAILSSEKTTPGQAALVYQAVDKEWKKAIEDIREMARRAILDLAKEKGEDNGKKGQRLEVTYKTKSFVISRNLQFHSAPEPDLIRALMEKRKLKEDEVFTTEVTTTTFVDKDKLAKLVESGKLTNEEIEACRKQKGEILKIEEK